MKRESMKDCKYFFYQYSEFHAFTRQSLAVEKDGQSHPAKTFNGSHPFNDFAKHPILNARKGSGCQRHCQISEKGFHKHSVRLQCMVSISESLCASPITGYHTLEDL